MSTIPIVKLGKDFKYATNYRERFENGLPNIVELEHLTVAGDVKFGRNITLKVYFFRCIIKANMSDAGHCDSSRK